MQTVKFTSSEGRGIIYSAPELTEIRISVEKGFAATGEPAPGYDIDDMDIMQDEEW